MPVRTFQNEARFFNLPHELNINGIDLSNEEEVEKLTKSLPFVDLEKATQGRLLNRDPICGVGDLPPEINPLEGHKLRGRQQSSSSNGASPFRDPILMVGDLGEEYNCLYTKRELKCKDRDDRNIITLEGHLGDELDIMRPHGGRPRNFIKQEDDRNPITGIGEYTKEWDPIWKYEGRHFIKRPIQVKRDPITHSVPPENMGDEPAKTYLKHFDNYKCTDVISHDDTVQDMRDLEAVTGIRHYPLQPTRNPITHQDIYGSPDDKKWRPGTKHFPDREKNGNIIWHNGLSDDIEEMTSKQEQSRQEAQCRVIRDPIAGTGIEESTKKSLWKAPNNYSFRSYLQTAKSNDTDSKSTEKGEKKKVAAKKGK